MSYNQNQPRDPKGSETGGQWAAMDAGNAIRNAASDNKKNDEEYTMVELPKKSYYPEGYIEKISGKEEIKGTKFDIGGNNIIIKTGYRSMKENWSELWDMLKEKKFKIIDVARAKTNSYYIEATNDLFGIDIRISNHSKENEDENIVIKDGYNKNINYHNIEISILKKQDFVKAKKWLSDNL